MRAGIRKTCGGVCRRRVHRPVLRDGLRWPRAKRALRLTCLRGGERQTALARRLARADAGGDDKCRCNRQHRESPLPADLSAICCRSSKTADTRSFPRDGAEHRRARGAIHHDAASRFGIRIAPSNPCRLMRSSSVRRLLSRGREGCRFNLPGAAPADDAVEARPSVEVPVRGGYRAPARAHSSSVAPNAPIIRPMTP